MKYSGLWIIIIAVFFMLISNSCDNRNPVSTGITLTLTAARDTFQVGNENDYIDLLAQVTDNTGDPISGVSVSFATNFGSVLGNGVTDDNGLATSSFWYNGNATGEATIRARYSGMEASVTIDVIDNNPYVLDVWAAIDTFYLGDNNHVTDVWAHLTDRDGNNLSNKTIVFSSENGFFTPQYSNTDENGLASVEFFYDADEASTIEIRAVYLTATAVSFIYIIEPEIVNLSIWSESDTVYAGTNSNTSMIYAQLTNEFNTPIADERIDFSATAGSILPWDLTDDNGIAEQIFYYNDRVEYSTVTASFHGIMASLTMTIIPFSYEISMVSADTLTIAADNDTLTFATVSVLVTGSLGVPVSGKTVQFIPSLGYMSESSAVTDNSGIAVSRLHDGGIAGLSHIEIYCDPDESYIDITIVPDNKNGRRIIENN